MADAVRMVALRLEEALERSRRLTQIDANDLLGTLLAIADEIDPPFGILVEPRDAAPMQ